MEKPKLKIKGRSTTENENVLEENNPMCEFCDYADKGNHNLCVGKMMTHNSKFCIHKDKSLKRE